MTTNAVRRPSTRFPLVTALLILVLGLLAVLAFVFTRRAPEGVGPPADFRLVTEVDLAVGPYANAELLAFTLADTAEVGIYYGLREIEAPMFNLSLVSADGAHRVLLDSTDYRTDAQGGGLWTGTLPAGSYRLLLNARGQGQVAIYQGGG